MTRYKSRVARRSRRRARRGTRKQSGGFVSSFLEFLGLGPKPTTVANPAAVAQPANQDANQLLPAPQPANQDANQLPPAAATASSLVGGRKTRHRRRSPRRHRK
jgi:hypothetical protein